MGKQGILLDTGTNEVEILELIIDNLSYGINVLKVKQILEYKADQVTHMYIPGLHEAVVGTLLFRGDAIPLVDLNIYFNDHPSMPTEVPLVVIVCEFNHTLNGFLIDGLDKIYRFSWDQLQSPNALVQSSQAMITGIVSVEDHEIMLLDFESIAAAIMGPSEPELAAESTPTTQVAQIEQRAQVKILAADDSMTVRRELERLLIETQYSNFTIFDNGRDAYEEIIALPESTENSAATVLVTDIEMPQMDGLTLCKRVKEKRPDIPVIVLSSMISPQMEAKCRAVAADAFLSKRQTGQLVSLLDRLCLS